jgi:hypothetical protein
MAVAAMADSPREFHDQQQQQERQSDAALTQPRLVRPVTALYSAVRYDLERLVDIAAGTDGFDVAIAYPSPTTPSEGKRQRGKKAPLDIVVLRVGGGGAFVGFLDDGSLVAFGLDDADLAGVRAVLAPAQAREEAEGSMLMKRDAVQRFRFTTLDDLQTLGYEAPDGVTTTYVDEGALNAIVLEDASASAVLPFVFCLGYNVKIDALNALLAPIADKVRDWRDLVRRTGAVPCTPKQARIRNSHVHRLATRHSRIGARPPIFSSLEFAQQRQVFNLACEHFEVHDRRTALKDHLESVTATLGYLSAEANHKTNHRLEEVICVLLFVGIVVHLVHPPAYAYE